MKKFRFDPESDVAADMRDKYGSVGARSVAALAGAALLFLSACNNDNQVLFEGFYFRSSAAPVDKKVTLKEFTVGVWDVDQSLTGAIEAGKYEATRYCIKNYGTSRVKWVSGPPENVEAPSLNDVRLVDGVLVFHGLCNPQ